ncbi:hypothetical protein SAMN05216553_104154 [Lentzea fradiae]|uniref:Subtilisin inhibitor-like n=1 Tax=Lentzea fradiae TaxID=200378 RepID=A0A1G7PYT9_9PSEU|nr:hypothetical protein [Lentzea fradiae]SDF91487.1 hypothetical protein SAMN05216553_104154 [Lentzea fradiae]
MGRFLVALALTVGFAVYAPALAQAAEDTRWQIEPCAEGTRALWLPRVDRAGTDISCTTEDARAVAVAEAIGSGSLMRMANVAVAGAQQVSDQSLTPESPCVLGAKGAIGNDIGTCVAA